MRTRTLLLLATLLTVATITAAGVAAGRPAPSLSVRRSAHPSSAAMRASAVLRSWDHRRAVAWSHGDAAALADLYGRGSRTGRSDVRDLRRWGRRGLRAVGLRQQTGEIEVRVQTSRRLVLAVTDRTVDGVAVGHRRRTALPVSAWATHRIVLRRVRGQWLVDEVRAQPAR